MIDDRRLIEDYLPIQAISRENITAKGHLNTLHVWWARRALAMCRSMLLDLLLPDPSDEHCPAATSTGMRT